MTRKYVGKISTGIPFHNVRVYTDDQIGLTRTGRTAVGEYRQGAPFPFSLLKRGSITVLPELLEDKRVMMHERQHAIDKFTWRREGWRIRHNDDMTSYWSEMSAHAFGLVYTPISQRNTHIEAAVHRLSDIGKVPKAAARKQLVEYAEKRFNHDLYLTLKEDEVKWTRRSK
jgi:hypothetical protein